MKNLIMLLGVSVVLAACVKAPDYSTMTTAKLCQMYAGEYAHHKKSFPEMQAEVNRRPEGACDEYMKPEDVKVKVDNN